MTDQNIQSTRAKVEAGLAWRYRKERMFQFFGMLATAVGVVFLVVFFFTLIAEGGRRRFGKTI